MLATFENYNLLKSNLPKQLDLSGYQMDYLAEKIGLSTNLFYTKKSNNSFSNEEFKKLIAIIWRNELQDILDNELLTQKTQHGKNLSATEFKQKLGWL